MSRRVRRPPRRPWHRSLLSACKRERFAVLAGGQPRLGHRPGRTGPRYFAYVLSFAVIARQRAVQGHVQLPAAPVVLDPGQAVHPRADHLRSRRPSLPTLGHRARPPAARSRATRQAAGVKQRRGSGPGPGRPGRRPARVPSTAGSARSMLGKRRAATTGTPSATTLPHGTWAPWTTTIGTTATPGSGRTWAARSASNETARKVGASG